MSEREQSILKLAQRYGKGQEGDEEKETRARIRKELGLPPSEEDVVQLDIPPEYDTSIMEADTDPGESLNEFTPEQIAQLKQLLGIKQEGEAPLGEGEEMLAKPEMQGEVSRMPAGISRDPAGVSREPAPTREPQSDTMFEPDPGMYVEDPNDPRRTEYEIVGIDDRRERMIVPQKREIADVFSGYYSATNREFPLWTGETESKYDFAKRNMERLISDRDIFNSRREEISGRIDEAQARLEELEPLEEAIAAHLEEGRASGYPMYEMDELERQLGAIQDEKVSINRRIARGNRAVGKYDRYGKQADIYLKRMKDLFGWDEQTFKKPVMESVTRPLQSGRVPASIPPPAEEGIPEGIATELPEKETLDEEAPPMEAYDPGYIDEEAAALAELESKEMNEEDEQRKLLESIDQQAQETDVEGGDRAPAGVEEAPVEEAPVEAPVEEDLGLGLNAVREPAHVPTEDFSSIDEAIKSPRETEQDKMRRESFNMYQREVASARLDRAGVKKELLDELKALRKRRDRYDTSAIFAKIADLAEGGNRNIQAIKGQDPTKDIGNILRIINTNIAQGGNAQNIVKFLKDTGKKKKDDTEKKLNIVKKIQSIEEKNDKAAGTGPKKIDDMNKASGLMENLTGLLTVSKTGKISMNEAGVRQFSSNILRYVFDEKGALSNKDIERALITSMGTKYDTFIAWVRGNPQSVKIPAEFQTPLMRAVLNIQKSQLKNIDKRIASAKKSMKTSKTLKERMGALYPMVENTYDIRLKTLRGIRKRKMDALARYNKVIAESQERRRKGKK